MTGQIFLRGLFLGWMISFGCYFSSCSSQQQQGGDGVEATEQGYDDTQGYDNTAGYDDTQGYDEGTNYGTNTNASLNNEYGANNQATNYGTGGYDNTADINSDVVNDTQGTDLLDNEATAIGGGNYGTNATATAGTNTTNLSAGGNYAATGTAGNYGAAVDSTVAAPAVPASAPPTGSTAPIPGGRVRYVPAGGVEIFSSPGGGQVVGTLQQGEHPLTFEENGFLRIAEGWYVPVGVLSDTGVGRNPNVGGY